MYYWNNSGIIYVSQTKGYDGNNGFAPEADRYRNGPVQSLSRALEMIGEMRCTGNLRPMVIAFMEDYYLEAPLVIPRELSGITLESYGERRKLIGGRKLTGWRADVYNDLPCLSAQLPEKTDGSGWDFTDLIVNGKYAPLSRYPKKGTLRAVRTEKDAKEGQSQPLFNPTKWFEAKREDLEAVPDMSGSTVNFWHYWVDAHSPVEAYDPDSGIVTMKYPSKFSINTRYGTQDGLVPMHTAAFRYYLTNVPSQFGVSGEWFFRRETGKVYYMPREGELAETLEVYVPVSTGLIRVQAADVRICNLELMCTKGDYESTEPSRDGSGREVFASDSQSVCGAPGAIVFEGAERGGIINCHLHGLGVHAIEIRPGCRFVRIEENTIEDICAGGISVLGGEAGAQDSLATFGCIIRRNRISHCGVRYPAGNGILVRHASNNEITENEICWLDYSGITVGWVWGYGESSTFGNIIRGNHIHHIGQGKLSDMGGIYLLGKQRGTVVAENRIHDVKAVVYGGWGIYTDEGSSYVTVENNVVFDTQSECFHQHYGCGNIVRNNIFAFGGNGCIKASRDEQHDGVLLENNIIVTDGIPFYSPRTALQPLSSSRNLYWDVSGTPMLLRRHGDRIYTYSDRLPLIWGESFDFDDWKTNCQKDAGSILGDPCFADLDNRDFRLLKNSPAIRLGFRPIEGFPAVGR